MNKEYKIIAAISMQDISTLLHNRDALPSDFVALKRKGLIDISQNGMYYLTKRGKEILHEYIQGHITKGK